MTVSRACVVSVCLMKYVALCFLLWSCPLAAIDLPEQLTQDDLQYLNARLGGETDREIAARLGVKAVSISQRRYRIAQRLGLSVDIETFLLSLVAKRQKELEGLLAELQRTQGVLVQINSDLARCLGPLKEIPKQ